VVRNPFRSEAEAFRFVLMTVGAFAAIAVASLLGGAWVGVPVWAVLTAVAATFYLVQRRAARVIRTAPPHVGDQSERRILVIVDGTAADETIVGAIEETSTGYRKRVLIVCPARVSQIDHWTSAVDGARAQAQRFLDESLARLRDTGIEARGEIGDEDPLRAIEDALRTFGADTILVVTPPEGFEGATARDVVAGARARFALPITRVVVDAGAQATAAQD
jgi:GABA permease